MPSVYLNYQGFYNKKIYIRKIIKGVSTSLREVQPMTSAVTMRLPEAISTIR